MWIRQKYTDICAKQRKYFSVFCIHRGKPHNGNGQGQDTSRYLGELSAIKNGILQTLYFPRRRESV